MTLSPSLLRLPGQHVHGGLTVYCIPRHSCRKVRLSSVSHCVPPQNVTRWGGTSHRTLRARVGGNHCLWCHRKGLSLALMIGMPQRAECTCCMGQPRFSGSWRPTQLLLHRLTSICELVLKDETRGFQGEFQPHIWLPVSIISFRFRESADSIPLAT